MGTAKLGDHFPELSLHTLSIKASALLVPTIVFKKNVPLALHERAGQGAETSGARGAHAAQGGREGGCASSSERPLGGQDTPPELVSG